MLHLAQVEKIESSGKLGLRLIARQRSEYTWSMLSEQDIVPLDGQPNSYREGEMVLATLSNSGQVVQVQSPNQWLLDILQTFLRTGITPTFLQEEAERAEQWRQNLTLQSQDLDRRALELEARREQIEQLEETLKREKKQMELMAAQYKDQVQVIDRQTTEISSLQQQIVQLEEALKHEQQQLANFLREQEISSQSPS